MADIVNLRQVRKRAARDRKDETAAANRAKFGRTKAERAVEEKAAEILNKTLDGAKREPQPKD